MQTQSATRGVVTFCDRNYFPGLIKLHESITTSFPCTLLCFDGGLTREQRARAGDLENVQVLDLPDDPIVAQVAQAFDSAPPARKPGKRIWPLWLCPLLIRSAPLRDVFWLDCDLLVLSGLEELFVMLGEGPVFTPESLAPELTPNDPALYRRLPIERSFDPAVPCVNGGVSGWRRGRDDDALDAYLRPVLEAARDPAVADAVAWWDQGALIWAIQSLGLENRVLSDPNWNLPVGHAGLPDAALEWDDELVGRLRSALPNVKLLHWNGRPVPWGGPPPER